MTVEPRPAPARLRDDPVLALPFLDMDELLGGYDLEAIRPPVAPAAAATSAAAPTNADTWRLAVGAGLAAVIAAVLAWNHWVAPDPVEPVIERLVEEVGGPIAHPPAAPLLPDRPPQERIAVAEPVGRRVPSPPAPAVTEPDRQVTEGAITDASLAEPPADPALPSPAPPVATLPLEQAAIDRARALLDAGAAAEAIAAVDAYEAAFPKRRLGAAASALRLEALVAVARWPEVEALSAALLSDPAFAARSTYLTTVRARALALQGRCDESRMIAQELPRADAKEILRACP